MLIEVQKRVCYVSLFCRCFVKISHLFLQFSIFDRNTYFGIFVLRIFQLVIDNGALPYFHNMLARGKGSLVKVCSSSIIVNST